MISYEIDQKYSVYGRSSKGYAKKYVKDGKWFKVSAGEFDAQAEVAVSKLLNYTNVNHVSYDICKVNGEYASVSDDYVGGGRFVSLNMLHKITYGKPLDTIINTWGGGASLKYTIEFVEEIIGDFDFKDKLIELLMVDALVFNEDRHTDNIGYIIKNGSYEFMQAFDFDAALFSCVTTLDKDTVRSYVRYAPSLPFFTTHKDQIAHIKKYFNASKIKLSKFDVEDITDGLWEETFTIGKDVIEGYLRTLRGVLYAEGVGNGQV
jgi:hypothetical protein